MITKQDLLEAIAECQGARSPNANTAIKLAAFYTILDHLDEDQPMIRDAGGYSFADSESVVRYNGQSEFAKAINGKSQAMVWPIMDELMDAMRLLQPKIYDGTMRKIQSI